MHQHEVWLTTVTPPSLFHSAVPGIRDGLRGDPETDTCKWKVDIIRPIKYGCVRHLLPSLSFICIRGPFGCLFSITSEFKSVRAALIASVPLCMCFNKHTHTHTFSAAIVMHEAPIFTSRLTRQHGLVFNLFSCRFVFLALLRTTADRVKLFSPRWRRILAVYTNKWKVLGMEFSSCRASALAAWEVCVLALRHTHQAECQSANNGRCLPISAARAHGVTDIYGRNW